MILEKIDGFKPVKTRKTMKNTSLKLLKKENENCKTRKIIKNSSLKLLKKKKIKTIKINKKRKELFGLSSFSCL